MRYSLISVPTIPLRLAVQAIQQGGATMLNSINSAADVNTLSNYAQLKQEQEQQNKESSVVNNTVSKATLDKAVEELNKALELTRTERRFIIDEELNRPIVKVINSDTKEVLRQIPTEEAVRISKHIGEMIGLLMDDRI